jgi:hypothetical protein
LRPGNSRNSFQKRFARASDHCAVDHLGGQVIAGNNNTSNKIK